MTRFKSLLVRVHSTSYHFPQYFLWHLMFPLSQVYNHAFRMFLSMPTACFHLPQVHTYPMFTPAACSLYAYRVFSSRLPRVSCLPHVLYSGLPARLPRVSCLPHVSNHAYRMFPIMPTACSQSCLPHVPITLARTTTYQGNGPRLYNYIQKSYVQSECIL